MSNARTNVSPATHRVVPDASNVYVVTDMDGHPVARVLANSLLQVGAPWLTPGDYIVFQDSDPSAAPVGIYLTEDRTRFVSAPADAAARRDRAAKAAAPAD